MHEDVFVICCVSQRFKRYKVTAVFKIKAPNISSYTLCTIPNCGRAHKEKPRRLKVSNSD
jgi:hypothetical protein